VIEMPKLSALFSIAMGPTILKEDLVEDGKVPVWSASEGSAVFGHVDRTDKLLRPGDLTVSARGSIGFTRLIEDECTSTQTTIQLRKRKTASADSKFVYYYLTAMRGALFPITQTAIPMLTVRDVGQNRILLPDSPTQRAVADFLDRETARIDLLIEKKQRLLDMVSPRFEALIHAARIEGTWRRFGFCVKSTTRPIPNTSDQSFVPLGLYNRGRGFFKKSDTDFDELGDSSFFFVEEGDLVFSGQFAWEGAVGLVSERESGCVVSHRYPVYVGTEGVISEYLYAYFRSHHGRFLMDNCSRGAAGRNRPLNTRILEKEKIPVPPLSIQDEVKHIVLFERRLKGKITPSIDRLREYRSALITAAVTGQISVSEWNKSGEVDRQLDSLADKVSA